LEVARDYRAGEVLMSRKKQRSSVVVGKWYWLKSTLRVAPWFGCNKVKVISAWKVGRSKIYTITDGEILVNVRADDLTEVKPNFPDWEIIDD